MDALVGTPLREKDVYSLRVDSEKHPDYSYWCVDGTFIAIDDGNGKLVLANTYWTHLFKEKDGSVKISVPGDTHKRTFEEIIELGELLLYCNLHDLDWGDSASERYYNPSDLFPIHTQHGYCKHYFVRKGAKRDPDVIVTYINKELQNKRDEIGRLARDIEWLASKRREVELGNTGFLI